jgi:hypothetical protein
LEWLKALFAKKKLIHSTRSEADYMRVRSRLGAEGVHYVVKCRRGNRYLGSEWSNFENPTEYNFYVRVEDEGRAYAAIHQR